MAVRRQAGARDRGGPSPPDPLPQNGLGEGEMAERRQAGARARGSAEKKTSRGDEEDTDMAADGAPPGHGAAEVSQRRWQGTPIIPPPGCFGGGTGEPHVAPAT